MDNNDIAYMLRMRALPKCNECKECATFLNLKGDGSVRCCMLSKRMIRNGIEISPKWCEKRKGNEVKTN